MKKIIYYLFIISTLLSVSCGDFLKEYSKDLAYATNCDDLNEIMMGSAYMKQLGNVNSIPSGGSNGFYPHLYLMDDDVEENVTKLNDSKDLDLNNMACGGYWFRRHFIWQVDPYTTFSSKDYEDLDMSQIYKHIATLNVIINYIKEFENDPIEQRELLRGEALFLRSAYYFLLVNMYGLPYVKETANKDLGIPLNTTEHIEDKNFSRNTVKEAYDLIVGDLIESIELLKDKKQLNYYRADIKASHVLLSRVYLYMGQWKLALEQTEAALKLGCPLRDLKEMNIKVDWTSTSWDKRDYLNDSKSPEIIFTMGSSTLGTLMPIEVGGYGSAVSSFIPSKELLNLYNEEDDLRRARFFVTHRSAFAIVVPRKSHYRKATAFEAYIIRGAEAYLNKAEALAMLDRDGEAKIVLGEFMLSRYNAGRSPDMSNLAGEKLMQFIRDERRREFCFECHRWFDLRRYAVSPKYAQKTTIRHNTYNVGEFEAAYELKPYGEDKAWVLPFPKQEITFNEGVLVDNLRDERFKIQ